MEFRDRRFEDQTLAGGGSAIKDPSSSGTESPSPHAGGIPTGAGATAAAAARAVINSSAILEPGTLLAGRYEIIAMLGLGGMGAVYKAYDRDIEREIAIKVIRPDLASNPELLQRFTQELLLARQIAHKNVVRIFDVHGSGGIKFITMEFIDGRDLRSLLAGHGKLPPGEALDIMTQACAGLAAAHAEGVIHRDLKPGNIMRDKNGRVVVMDFGLARTLDGGGMTQTGVMLGTMEYMSPEQAKAEPLDERSDLFTIGLILYELITGKSPYQAESAVASLLKRTQERAISMSDIDATISRSLSMVVGKCLERDAKNRYQSIGELGMALEELQGRRPVSIFPGQTIPAARSRWIMMALVAVAIVAIGALAITVFLRVRVVPKAHGPLSVVVADFSNRTGDAVFNDTLEPMLNVALEGASFINAYDRSQARKLAAKLPHPSDKLDEEAARLVAVSQGISTVITGELNRDGGGYTISARAMDPVSGKLLAKTEVTAGSKEEVLSAIPKLAAPIRKALGDTTPASVQFEEVAGGFTAASLEAVHENAIGVDQQFAGKFEEAFQSFQKATEIDPKFARAYTGMAAMALNLGKPQDAEKYMKLAMANVDRMTERERYRNRGLYYNSTGDWQKCVEDLNQLVTRYPADRVGQNNLAGCYTQLRDAAKAVEAAQRAVEIVPKGAGQRLNLSFTYSFAGDFVGAEREARAGLEINPSSAQGHFVLAEAQLGQGQLDQAAQSYHQLEKFGGLAASMAVVSLADLAAYQGRFTEAARILQQGAESDLSHQMSDGAARKFAALAGVKLWQGDKPAALAAANKALSNNQSVKIRFLVARVYVETGELAKAQKLAAGLSSELTSEPQAYGKIIEGMSEVKRGDARQAIKPLTDANNLLDTWIGRFELGRAYLEAEAFTQADSEFERCLKRRGEAIELFDDNVPTYAYFPPVYYYAGRVREGMNSEGAKDFYRSYLNVRGASREDPLVSDVHRRLGQ
jgi:tetratricopeptide (TPR) repeat protein